MIDDQPFTAKIDADIPESVAVGEPSRKFAIAAGTTVDADLTPKLHWIGVKTVEGTVEAKIGVSAPQGDRNVRVPLDIPKTGIPSSGSFDVTATGAAPALTFSQPGNGRITVGDVAVHVVGKKANGKVLGKLDVRCALDDGQDNVAGSFEITGTGAGSTTSGASGATPASPPAGGTSAPTSSATHGTATGSIANTGQDTGDLILPAMGTLVAGVVAFFFGSRLKNRRRAGRDG